jgi:hypothetical protein
MSRSIIQSDLLVPSAELALTTITSVSGTSRDTNSLLSGNGWEVSSGRIQVTCTSQATARDGHREGATLLLGVPSGWVSDGSKGLLIVMDDFVWPNAAASTMWFGAGLIVPGAAQANQIGNICAAHDNTGPAVRTVRVATVSQGASAALGATMTGMEIRILPVWDNGTLYIGTVCQTAFSGAAGAHVSGAEMCVLLNAAASGAALGSAPQLALGAGFSGTSAGNARTFGARIRYAVINTTPLTAVFD